MTLDGRVALVTGASGGLGRLICAGLAAEGVNLALVYGRGRDRAEAVAADAARAGVRAAPIACDLGDPAAIEAAAVEAARLIGRIDMLVNNAGVASPSVPIEDHDAAVFDRLMAVNLRAPFLMARAAAPHLRAAGPGRIVNIGSVTGQLPAVAPWSFGLSKHCVIPLTNHLAAALAPDVLVNCVAPGLMLGTQMTATTGEATKAAWRGVSVLGRTTSLEDVAAQVLRFCAVEATTGRAVFVDGGVAFG